MPKQLTLTSRVHTTTRLRRLFYWGDVIVPVDVRSLASVADCQRLMLRGAAAGSWWMVGILYGELHGGTLPVALDGQGRLEGTAEQKVVVNDDELKRAFHQAAAEMGVFPERLEVALNYANGRFYWAARVWGSGVADSEYQINADNAPDALGELTRALPTDLRDVGKVSDG